jgi:hypothetical protein
VKYKMNVILVTTASVVSRTQLNAVYQDCCQSNKGRVWGRILLSVGSLGLRSAGLLTRSILGVVTGRLIHVA